MLLGPSLGSRRRRRGTTGLPPACLLPWSLVALKLILLLLLASPLPGVQSGIFDFLLSWRPRTIVDEYTLLNRLLVERVDDDSAVENIVEALKLLAQVKDQQNESLQQQQEQRQQQQQPAIDLPSQEALIQFTNLIKLIDPEESYCNLEGYEILKANEEATATEILRPIDDRRALRRIEMVIYEVAYEHAEDCSSVYPKRFAQLLRAAPVRPRNDIVEMMDGLIATSETIMWTTIARRMMDARQIAAWKAKGVDVTGKREARALLAYLRYKSENEPQHRYLEIMSHPEERDRWIIYDRQVVMLMERFIYNRCKFLLETFKDVLVPALFEQRIHKKGHKYRASNEKAANLMIWLQYHRLCGELVDKRDRVEKSVISAIWEEL